jgi:purine catabolism regulator
VTFVAHSDRAATFSSVPPSPEPVLSQLPPADRTALQDSMGLTVDQLLDLPGLTGTIVVGGATGTRRIVRHIVVEEPNEPLGTAGPDVLVVLSGRLGSRDPAQSRAVIERLHRAGSGALAFRSEGGQGNAAGEVPAEVLAEADRRGFPVLALPSATRLDEVVAEVLGAIIDKQTQALSLANRMHNQFIDVVGWPR